MSHLPFLSLNLAPFRATPCPAVMGTCSHAPLLAGSAPCRRTTSSSKSVARGRCSSRGVIGPLHILVQRNEIFGSQNNETPDPHLKSIMRVLVRISLALAGSRRRRERATGRGLTFGLLTPVVTISGGISHNFLRLSYVGCQYTSNVRHRRPVTRSRRLGTRSLLCAWYHCVRLQPRFDNIHLILDFVQCSSILTCSFFRVLC